MDILFASAIDFKEKSIQVIYNTPMAYVADGWKVDYVVARDNLRNGNYDYEEEINPNGINVYRMYWPFANLRVKVPRLLFLILNKISALYVVMRLAIKIVHLTRQKDYDVVYGYELHGTLAVRVARLFSKPARKAAFVSRFQGTFLEKMMAGREHLRIAFNFDLIAALRTRSDLLIMTNDGTQGDKALARLLPNTDHVRFWVNGVDRPIVKPRDIPNPMGLVTFVSISRLVVWKRVERNIRILAALRDKGFANFHYKVIGDGDLLPSLQALVVSTNMGGYVTFLGALKHVEAMQEMQDGTIFLSMYDNSNVGNPLLEAIRAGKIIATLDNGDTASWISHGENGLIFAQNDNLIENAATSLQALLTSPAQMAKIAGNVRTLADEKLWTWQERLDTEVQEVRSLCA